jgi:soluble lytic murein transglycosylase-like protein
VRPTAARQILFALRIAAAGAGSATTAEPPLLRSGLFEDTPEGVAISAGLPAEPAPPAKADIVQASLGVSLPSAALPSEPPLLEERATVPLPAAPVVRAAISAVIDREARQQGIPRELVEGVVRVESGFDPRAVGTVGEVGLMQIRPQTARMLGFAGSTAELFEPDVNVRYAAAYLAGAWRLAKGDLCRALMKYRAGHGEERMSTLSVEYCRRVRNHLESIGSPLASAVLPKADFVSPGGAKFLGLGGFGGARQTDIAPARTASLADMASWRRRSGKRGAAPSSRVSSFVVENRTPLYRAMLGGRS